MSADRMAPRRQSSPTLLSTSTKDDLLPLARKPLGFSPTGLGGTLSSGHSISRSSRYRLTLPESSSKPTRRFSLGTKHSGTQFRMIQPRTPRLAASMAAYSSRRVRSDVQ
ncbi:hypothetical protein VM1G_11628 [Cytospora mali]|uniref:Uncharacterized protein n=1 Tax=Cytospora mali TaxID=578113 RepID=A0A194VZN7_CYTMA|nr:hypothetical protein VM1G_11628 [Valsa mali]